MKKFVKIATGAAMAAALIVGGAASAQAYPVTDNGDGTNAHPTLPKPNVVVRGNKVIVQGKIKASGTKAGATVKVVVKNQNGKVIKTVTVRTTKGGKYDASVALPKSGKYTISTKVLAKGKYGATKTKSTTVKIKGKK